jgi:hypothetical protein
MTKIQQGFLIGKPTIDSGRLFIKNAWITRNNSAAEKRYFKVDAETGEQISDILYETVDKITANDNIFAIMRWPNKIAKGPANPDGSRPREDVWKVTIPSKILGDKKGLGIQSKTFGLLYEATQQSRYGLEYEPEVLLASELADMDIAINYTVERGKFKEILQKRFDATAPEFRHEKKVKLYLEDDNMGLSYFQDQRNGKYQSARIYNKTMKECFDRKISVPGDAKTIDVIRMEINFSTPKQYLKHGLRPPNTLEDLIRLLDEQELLMTNAIHNTFEEYQIPKEEILLPVKEKETPNEMQLRLAFEEINKMGGTVKNIRRIIYAHKDQDQTANGPTRFKQKALEIWTEIENRKSPKSVKSSGNQLPELGEPQL